MSRIPRGRAGGYTLMELMITIALAATLLAMGAGVFFGLGKRTAYEQSLSSLAGLVRKAQNTSTHVPSSLVLDPEVGSIVGLTEKTLQELRFEVRTMDDGTLDWIHGIGGREVEVTGGEVEENAGRVGAGLRLDGGSVDCGDYAAYDVTEGLSLELWIKPDVDSSVASNLIRKGTAFEVNLFASQRGSTRLRVSLGVDDKGSGETIRREVPLPPLHMGEWWGVKLVYDRSELVISTSDGHGFIERDRYPDVEGRPLRPDIEAPLEVCDGGFRGYIDDFRFGGIHSDEPLQLPRGVQLVGKMRRRIVFDNGRLDARTHAGVELIALRHEGRTTVLEIGGNGQIQDVRYVEGDGPLEKPQEADKLREDQKKE
jgi:hypothetical protein